MDKSFLISDEEIGGDDVAHKTTSNNRRINVSNSFTRVIMIDVLIVCKLRLSMIVFQYKMRNVIVANKLMLNIKIEYKNVIKKMYSPSIFK